MVKRETEKENNTKQSKRIHTKQTNNQAEKAEKVEKGIQIIQEEAH